MSSSSTSRGISYITLASSSSTATSDRADPATPRSQGRLPHLRRRRPPDPLYREILGSDGLDHRGRLLPLRALGRLPARDLYVHPARDPLLHGLGIRLVLRLRTHFPSDRGAPPIDAGGREGQFRHGHNRRVLERGLSARPRLRYRGQEGSRPDRTEPQGFRAEAPLGAQGPPGPDQPALPLQHPRLHHLDGRAR